MARGEGGQVVRGEAEGEGVAGVYLRAFDVDEAKVDLEGRLAYCRNEREAIPSDSPAKCSSCPFKEVCDSSLA